jgi:putative ABC transport system permease protein
LTTSLSWFNLAHNKARTLAAVAGVSFAVILIFMQLGFLGSLRSSATVIYDALDFDVCVRSKDYLHLSDARTFPYTRLLQAAAVPGVERAIPFRVGITRWRIPPAATRQAGETRGIMVMGVRPGDPVFRVSDIQQKMDSLLSVPEYCLIDRETRRDYGPVNGIRFGDEDIQAGVETEVGDDRMRLVGHFTLGAGFAADGAVIMNDRGFARVAKDRGPDQVSLGLIQLGGVAPAEGAEAAAGRIAAVLPDDVDVLSREQVRQAEIRRWVDDTSYGTIFRLGVVVAMVVGTAIVYQVLASDVAAMLPEYATLKAIGYRNRFLAGVVLQEAMILALLGFVPGLLASRALYGVTAAAANIPIVMTTANMLLVLALSVAMCLASGVAALRRLFRADPAELF